MSASFRKHALPFLRALASFAALAGGLASLVYLATRLEVTPEIGLSPWEGTDAGAPLVVVDAGHGGHDGGAVANGLIEKNVALDLAVRVRHHLEAQGVRVKMTRQTDVFLALDKRSASAAEASAFVSIHLNTSVDAPEVCGIETYFARRKSLQALQARQPAAESLPIEGDRSVLLAESVQQHACRASKADNRGVKEKAYAVITHAPCPAVLVECGFLTNTPEAARLGQQEYRDRLAEGIARGVAGFLKTGRSVSRAPRPTTLAGMEP